MVRLLDTQFPKQKQFFETSYANLDSNFSKFTLSKALELQPSKKLKIALVTETWSPEINGVANSLLNLCQGLQKRGHQILLIRPRPKVKCKRFQPDAECWVRAQAIPKYPTLQFGWPQFSKISKSLDQFQPDIVHIVTEGPLGFASLMVAKSKNIPVSSGFHSAFQEFSRYFEFPFLVKPIEKYLTWFHRKTMITCVPSQDTKLALREIGIDGDISVVGRGVDTQLFNSNQKSHQLRAEWNADADTNVLISVGRLSPEKEVGLVIQTYIDMKNKSDQKIKLVIVGDGPDRDRLEHMAKDHDVIFTGSLVGEQLASAYASADVFIFPSQVETFGNVALEALASGLPIVAYDYACAKKHVIHEQTGWLIPLGDTDLMIDAIHALPQRKVLNQMGALAEKNVSQVGWLKPVSDFEKALLNVVLQN